MKSGSFFLGVLVGASFGATLALRWREAARLPETEGNSDSEEAKPGTEMAPRRLRQSWIVLILPISIGNIYAGGAKPEG